MIHIGYPVPFDFRFPRRNEPAQTCACGGTQLILSNCSTSFTSPSLTYLYPPCLQLIHLPHLSSFHPRLPPPSTSSHGSLRLHPPFVSSHHPCAQLITLITDYWAILVDLPCLPYPPAGKPAASGMGGK